MKITGIRERLFLSISFLIAMALALSCSGKEESKAPANRTTPPTTASKPAPGTFADSTLDRLNTLPPKYDSYYVLDRRSNTIFGIDLNTNKVAARLLRETPLVAIQYDPARNWIYEATGKPQPGIAIFDAATGRYLQKFVQPDVPAGVLYNPVQQRLYVASEDSSVLRVFLPDSMKFILNIGLNIQNMTPIHPTTLMPGPAGKMITANGKRGSVTQIFTENNFMYQTIVIHQAFSIDYAYFSYDGNSSFSCDTERGSLYRVEFGTGKVLGEKHELKRPRFVQLEIASNTVVVAVGKTEVLMLNADTFRETGKVDLAEYGEEILSLEIPPKANYAEVLMDYKGVTRWLRFDVQNWEPLRMVELY